MSHRLIHLIIGKNKVFIQDAVARIQCDSPNHHFQSIKHSLCIQTLITRCATIDLFSSVNGWVVYDPAWMKKKDPQTLSQIQTLLQLIHDHGMVLLMIVDAIDKRTAIYKQLKKAPLTETLCPELQPWETNIAVQWVNDYIKRHKITSSASVIEQLVADYANNLPLIKASLDTLMVAIYPRCRIEPDDVVHIGSPALGYYRAVSDAIERGRAHHIIRGIHDLLMVKEDPQKIINHLVFQFSQALPIVQGIDAGYSAKSLANILNRHPFYIQKRCDVLSKNPLRHAVSPMIQYLAMLDREVKKGAITSRIALVMVSQELKNQQ